MGNPDKLSEKKKDFQYSLRIVGFRDQEVELARLDEQ